MNQRRFHSIVDYAVTMLLLCLYVSHQTKTNTSKTPPLKTVTDVPLPGPAVRFDYQSLDSTTGRLYIAHMNADRIWYLIPRDEKSWLTRGIPARTWSLGGTRTAARLRVGYGQSRSSRR